MGSAISDKYMGVMSSGDSGTVRLIQFILIVLLYWEENNLKKMKGLEQKLTEFIINAGKT